MLSKPPLESSPGNSVVASTVTSSRSRTAFAYSARFKRCSAGAPGFGAARAAASSDCSSQRTNASTLASAGRGSPGGGIKCPRSLRIAVSQTSASACRLGRLSAIEREVAGELGVVVATDAVAVEQRPMLRGARRAMSIHV